MDMNPIVPVKQFQRLKRGVWKSKNKTTERNRKMSTEPSFILDWTNNIIYSMSPAAHKKIAPLLRKGVRIQEAITKLNRKMRRSIVREDNTAYLMRAI